MQSASLVPQPEPRVDVWSMPPPGPRGAEPDRGDAELPLAYYWALVLRQRWRIASFVVVVTTAATLFTLTRPKQYDATMLLRVDPLSSPLVGQDQRNGQVDTNLLVATEGQVLTSPAVVQETIDKLNLGTDPEFAAESATSNGAPPAPGKLLEAVTKRINVRQPVGTELLDVTFRSHRPELSAEAANGLAAQFLEHENVIRAQTLTDSSRAMAGQLDTMRAEMENDEAALVKYEAENDVIDADDKTNIYQARLSAINDDLGKAQSQRMELEADYRVVSQGGLDALLASKLGEQLLPDQQRLINDQRQLARDATIYGPQHPTYRQQLEVVQHDQQALDDGAALVRQQVADQYRAALAREALIQRGLQQQKAAFDAFSMRAIKYSALKAAADGSARLYYDLQQRIQDAAVAAGLRSEDVAVVSPAQPPVKPSAPHPLLVGLITLFGTALFGVAAAVAAGLMDRTVGNADQVELRFRVPVIGALPEVPTAQVGTGLSLMRQANPGGEVDSEAQPLPYREAAYAIYSALQFALGDGAHPVAVTSSLPGEGKSTLISYLAVVGAALGRRTVLVDADMRKPNIHRIYGLPNRSGLSNALRRHGALGELLQAAGPNLSVLTSGPVPRNPTELLHLGLGDLLEELQTQFDLILIDCPPLLGFGDSIKIASLADGVLLVAHSGTTQQAQLASSLRHLNSVQARLLGVVLNRVNTDRGGEYSYYHNYYYRSVQEEEAHETERTRLPGK